MDEITCAPPRPVAPGRNLPCDVHLRAKGQKRAALFAVRDGIAVWNLCKQCNGTARKHGAKTFPLYIIAGTN